MIDRARREREREQLAKERIKEAEKEMADRMEGAKQDLIKEKEQRGEEPPKFDDIVERGIVDNR